MEMSNYKAILINFNGKEDFYRKNLDKIVIMDPRSYRKSLNYNIFWPNGFLILLLKINLPEDNLSEAYSENSQKSKMELYPKIVNDFIPINIFAKSSILHL